MQPVASPLPQRVAVPAEPAVTPVLARLARTGALLEALTTTGTAAGALPSTPATKSPTVPMEPLTNAASLSHVRTVGSNSSPGALFVNGRVVEARIVSVGDGGAVTLAIGREQLVATTDVSFEPGQRVQLEARRDSAGERILSVVAQSPEPPWWGALRSAIGRSRPIGEALTLLAARLRATLGSAPGGTTAPESPLTTLGRQLEAHAFDPTKTDGSALRDLLGRGGRLEAQLAQVLLGGANIEASLARVLGDLKGELLRALRDLPEGPLREAVARTLASVESEQWVNVARQRAGESTVWSVPVPDVEGWATARLWVDPERAGKEEGGKQQRSRRLTLSLQLSRTGPLRADLVATNERLLVRVLVERPELAQRLREDADTLTTILARGSRRVDFSVRVGSPTELRPEHGLAQLESVRGLSLTDFVA